MKFIFPQNYNFNNKILGIIEYSSAIFMVVWSVLIFIILNFIFTDLSIKIFLFIIFCFPIFIFSIIGFNNENILYVFIYIVKFIFKKKLLFFSKFS